MIVLVTLVITVAALTAFLDKASTDLIVAARDADARRLRLEAYSALEVTLSVLSTFNQTVGSLHSPAEGWGDPLTFANYTPTEGRTVEVSFEDESGRISLPNVDATTLAAVFDLWGISTTDAQRLTDALLGWIKPNYTPNGSFIPDYDQAAIPYGPPGRSLRSYDELAAIDVAREIFYGEDGRPNELWHRFADTFSLLDYRQPNLNSARPDVLAALGGLDAVGQQSLEDYTNGTGAYEAKGPEYFRSVDDAAAIVSAANPAAFTTHISALRIHITVHDGRAVYRLGAVVTIPGQQAAQTVEASATGGTSGASATTNSSSAANTSPTSTGTASRSGSAGGRAGGRAGGSATAGVSAGSTGAASLNYPFTVLEINENNDPVPVAPPPPPSE